MNFEENDDLKEWSKVSTVGSFLRVIHRYFALNYSRCVELGVHPGQIPMIKFLVSNPGANQRELAGMLHVKPPTVAVTVKRMERAGLIYRVEDERDRRVCRIFLTEKGKNTSNAIHALVRESEEILLRGFSKAEEEQAKEFFRRMTDNLNMAGGKET